MTSEPRVFCMVCGGQRFVGFRAARRWLFGPWRLRVECAICGAVTRVPMNLVEVCDYEFGTGRLAARLGSTGS